MTYSKHTWNGFVLKRFSWMFYFFSLNILKPSHNQKKKKCKNFFFFKLTILMLGEFIENASKTFLEHSVFFVSWVLSCI